jgi:hypothetical protein
MAKEMLLKCINSTVKKFLEIGVKEIIFHYPIPESVFDIPNEIEKSFKFGWNITKFHILRAEYECAMADLREVMKNVTDTCPICSLLDPATVLCDKTICPTFFIEEDNILRSYYRDLNHLNDYGSKKLSGLFDQTVTQAVR